MHISQSVDSMQVINTTCAHIYPNGKKHKQLQNIWRYSFSILDTVENVSFLCPSALRPVMLFSSLSLPNALLIHASILLKNDSHISLVIMVQQNIFEKKTNNLQQICL